MCWQTIADAWDATTDAVEYGFESAGNWVGNDPIANSIPLIGTWGAPFLEWSWSDYSTVDNDEVERPPATRIKELKEDTGDGDTRNLFPVAPEPVNQTFEEVLRNIGGANPNIEGFGRDFAQAWADVQKGIAQATETFRTDLHNLANSENVWEGEAKNAAIKNITESLRQPAALSGAAGAMDILVDTFAKTIGYTWRIIMGNAQQYELDLGAYPQHADEIKGDYNGLAYQVLKDWYAPNITDLAARKPAFTDGKLPSIGSLPPGPPRPDDHRPEGQPERPQPGSLGDPTLPAGIGAPDIPEISDPPTPGAVPGDPAGSSTPPAGVPGNPTAPLTEAAKTAAGAAGDAAKQAGQAGNSLKPPGDLPREGALAMGPKGPDPLKAGGAGSAGGKAPGGGGGAGPSAGLSNRSPASAPLMASAGKMPTPAVASAAGPNNMAGGSPGMGAPGAGQRGGDNNAKDHKPIKALTRRWKELSREPDAVVPVIGDEPGPEAAQPGTPEAAQTRTPENARTRTPEAAKLRPPTFVQSRQ
jgi:hypothetical protein